MFNLGRVVMTHGVHARTQEDPHFYGFCLDALSRHASGDWGTLSVDDWKLNDRAAERGEGRIFSAYQYNDSGAKVWIITEADRSATTILFPSEY